MTVRIWPFIARTHKAYTQQKSYGMKLTNKKAAHIILQYDVKEVVKRALISLIQHELDRTHQTNNKQNILSSSY